MSKDKSPITTHVLDLATGKPGAGIPVSLEKHEGQTWTELARGKTNDDGRVEGLLKAGSTVAVGRYRLTFELAAYQNARGVQPFFPEAQLVFEVRDPAQHYHVPLLLSPFGFSTYRGS